MDPERLARLHALDDDCAMLQDVLADLRGKIADGINALGAPMPN